MKWKEDKSNESAAAADSPAAAAAAGSATPTARAKSDAGVDEHFFERVYEQVARVPAGVVCTYGTIAELAGYPGKSREVGYTMSQVRPEQGLRPHRIVNAKGTLAPPAVFGGTMRQRALLEAEGVTFLTDGTIDMAHHTWPPKEPEEPDQLSLF